MPKLAFHEIEKLFRQLLVPFYEVRRDMPLPFTVRRFENDAEHSWSLATLACSLVSHIDPTLDTGKIAEYALVHDLTEIHAGDTSVWAEKEHLASKKEREETALKKILAEHKSFPWLTKTLTEYERQGTSEAQFVKAVDKYIALLFDYIDKGQYYQDHKITIEDFEKHMEDHRQKASLHPGVKKYYEEIRTILLAHPEFFYSS